MLLGKTSGVASELAVCADDSMAGHDDRDGIGAVGLADGANRAGISKACGKLAVAD